MNRIIAVIFSVIIICVAIGAVFVNVADIRVGTTVVTNTYPAVIIDAGHGGEDGGTSSADGILEKNINLSIANKLASMLEASGYTVLLTRTEDEQIGNNSLPTIRQRKVSDIRTRLSIAHSYPEAVFISIHQNHYSQPKYQGLQVFYSPKSPDSKLLAQSVQSSVVKMIQPDNKRSIKEVGSNIYLLYNIENPSILVECGFLSNTYEAKMLINEAYQKKIALSIMCGIINYLEDQNGKG